MLFAPPPERAALTDSACRFIERNYPRSGVRARMAASTFYDQALWSEVADHGWLATNIDEDRGGLGLGLPLLSHLIEALASGLMLEPLASQTAVAGTLLNRIRFDGDITKTMQDWLAGRTIIALAHHGSERDSFYGAPVAATFTGSDTGFELTGRKTGVVDGAAADAYLVSARAAAAPHELALFLVPRNHGQFEVTARRSFDGRNLAELEFSALPVPCGARVQCASPVSALIEEALSVYVFLLACESLGLMQALIKLTYEHLNERVQFGRKLADFQALQHRLVDMVMAATRAESLLELTRTQLEHSNIGGLATSIAAAKIRADDAATFVAEEAIQLHGAIGMTDEYIAGHFYKRVIANRLIAGTRAEHLLRTAARHP